MKAFYFGEREKRLYGVYHTPAVSQPGVAGSGVVLCCPFGYEYMTSHRAFRQLARRLSRSGFHVLRFDYFGTGNSSGDGRDVSIQQWLEDICAAVTELRDMASLRRVSLVGFRLGGALAAMATSRLRDLDALALWDPVASGTAYLAELQNAAKKEPWKCDSTMHAESGSESIMQVNGFPLTDDMAKEISKLDLMTLATCDVHCSSIVATRDFAASEHLANHLGTLGIPVMLQRLDGIGSFGAADGFSTAVLVPEVQDAIVGFVGCARD